MVEGEGVGGVVPFVHLFTVIESAHAKVAEQDVIDRLQDGWVLEGDIEPFKTPILEGVAKCCPEIYRL
jgi:hypothetical protein